MPLIEIVTETRVIRGDNVTTTLKRYYGPDAVLIQEPAAWPDHHGAICTPHTGGWNVLDLIRSIGVDGEHAGVHRKYWR